jgi:hypothetical protein
LRLQRRSAAVGGGGAQPQRIERETAFRIIPARGAYSSAAAGPRCPSTAAPRRSFALARIRHYPGRVAHSRAAAGLCCRNTAALRQRFAAYPDFKCFQPLKRFNMLTRRIGIALKTAALRFRMGTTCDISQSQTCFHALRLVPVALTQPRSGSESGRLEISEAKPVFTRCGWSLLP